MEKSVQSLFANMCCLSWQVSDMFIRVSQMEIKTVCFMFTYETCQLSRHSFGVAQDTLTYTKEGHLYLQMWFEGLDLSGSSMQLECIQHPAGFPLGE